MEPTDYGDHIEAAHTTKSGDLLNGGILVRAQMKQGAYLILFDFLTF